MPLTRRAKMRPLGFYIPESRLEIQVEKAMFKTNMTILSDLLNQSRMEMEAESPHPNTPEQMVPPEERSFLSRNEQYERINNAQYSRYNTPVSDRVVSAGVRRFDTRYRRTRPMCGRQYELGSPMMSCAHCEVLGQYYCTDCTQLRKRIQSAKKQKLYFPNVDVSPRSLIAPTKVERLLSSDQYGIIKRNKVDVTGQCFINDRHSFSDDIRIINEPIVFTQNDVYERLRLQHREQGNSVFGKSPRKDNSNSIGYSREVSKLRRELTDVTPQEMKITVTFSKD